MNNVAKHAEATHVSVLINRQRTVIFMIIEDNGKGFNVAFPPVTADGHGTGLTAMRERVELLHGKLLVESSNKGTTIAATVPIPAEVV